MFTEQSVHGELVGKWCSKYGNPELSQIEITKHSKKGSLKGIFSTPFYGLTGKYKAFGRVHNHNIKEKGQSLSLSIIWDNKLYGDSGALTTWTGQYFPLRKEIVLASFTVKEDVWEGLPYSTNIYHETFEPCDGLPKIKIVDSEYT